MPRSAKPRKQYRPKGVNPTAHIMGMMGASALHIDDRTVWSLALDSAITSVAQGKASVQQWSCLFEAAALLEGLVKVGKAKDPDNIVGRAEDTCVAIISRYKQGQRAVRAQELADLRALFTAWLYATSNLTQGEKFQAEQRAARMIECKQIRVLENYEGETCTPQD